MKNKGVAIVQKYGQANSYNTGDLYWSEGCDDAAIGFRRLGYKVRGFDSRIADWPAKAKVNKFTPVKGSVQSVRYALRYLGFKEPENVDIPSELREMAGRKIWTSTVGEVKRVRRNVFVKPLKFQKDFSGHVINTRCNIWRLNKLPDNYELLCQEVVNFKGEMRFYVINKEIVGASPYRSGVVGYENYMKFARDAVKKYKSQPAGYCIDIGWMNRKALAVVEVNEGFSCGNYGIAPELYAKMIEARWREMTAY